MMQSTSKDQGLFQAADRLWGMVNDQLDAAVSNLAGDGVDWNKWQLEGVSFFELVVEDKAAEMFPDSQKHTQKADVLRSQWEVALSARKMTKKAVNRSVELISMLGTLYLLRESMRADGATPYFDLAADAYRATGALMEVLHEGQKRSRAGRATGADGGKTAAVNTKATALGAWAVQQYSARGGDQPADSFARGLSIPDHLKDADVEVPARVMADAIRKYRKAKSAAPQ